MNGPGNERLTVFTIGHSTRSVDEFVRLLQPSGIHALVDIRTIPRSRTNPQFNQTSFPKELAENRIEYHYIRELGGLRKARAGSLNTGWRNESFRGFADYMTTAEFREGLRSLIELSKKCRAAIMCAEAVPWRCHRSLVADALLVRGIDVFDIIGPVAPKQHRLTPFAKVEGLDITYPSDEGPSTPE